MKKILLLLLLSLIFGQTDNIGSEAFNLTADHLFHSGRDKAFSDGTILFKSNNDRTTVDSSAFFISDSTAGTRATGMFLLQEGDTIYSSAADLNILEAFANSGYTVVIDSSGYLLDVPRTVYGWSHELIFSATDYNTIAWSSGDLYFANNDTFNINAGNTGNISDITYIYFDEDVSATVLQTTTEAGNSVGLGRIIVCVGKDVANVTKNAVFQVFGNSGQSSKIGTTQIDDNSITTGLILAGTILAEDIATNTITANELAANSVTTNELNFTAVNQDSILYQINASSEGLNISGDRINITGATTFAAGYNPSDGSMVIYQLSAPGTRPSGDALQNGDSWIDTTSAQGNVPKIWTGSEWRIAFTYIHGGYIKTGQIDADYIDVDDIFAENITATGIITGATIRTQTSGSRAIIDTGGVSIYYDGTGTFRGRLSLWNQSTNLGQIYYDNTNFKIRAQTGAHHILFDNNDIYISNNANITGTLDAATLNTGQGDNELYDMDQNVETSSIPQFVGLNISEIGSAPNHTAGIGKLWAKDDTYAPLRYTTDNGEDLWVSVAEVKGTTGHPAGWEGKIEINTFDNKVYIYAEGVWRELATW